MDSKTLIDLHLADQQSHASNCGLLTGLATFLNGSETTQLAMASLVEERGSHREAQKYVQLVRLHVDVLFDSWLLMIEIDSRETARKGSLT